MTLSYPLTQDEPFSECCILETLPKCRRQSQVTEQSTVKVVCAQRPSQLTCLTLHWEGRLQHLHLSYHPAPTLRQQQGATSNTEDQKRLVHLWIEMDTEGEERHYTRHGWKVTRQAATLSLSPGWPEVGKKQFLRCARGKIIPKGSLSAPGAFKLYFWSAGWSTTGKNIYTWLKVSVLWWLSPGYRMPPRCLSWSYLFFPLSTPAQQTADRDFLWAILPMLSVIFKISNLGVPHFPFHCVSWYYWTQPSFSAGKELLCCFNNCCCFCFATGAHVDLTIACRGAPIVYTRMRRESTGSWTRAQVWIQL